MKVTAALAPVVERPRRQTGCLLRTTTVAPKASSASAKVCGSGTEAVTSPGRTATAYPVPSLPTRFW